MMRPPRSHSGVEAEVEREEEAIAGADGVAAVMVTFGCDEFVSALNAELHWVDTNAGGASHVSVKRVCV